MQVVIEEVSMINASFLQSPIAVSTGTVMRLTFNLSLSMTSLQGCSLGLERLGLETVSRRFLRRLGLVSVLSLLGLRLETQRLARRSHVQYQNS